MRTFDVPAGYHLYVGSAFGAGGVAARVGRHLTPGTVKKWNVDYLKDRAAPVEVWWTHDAVRRECAWSEVLAALPGLTVAAPGFGSNDCTTCPAHLYFAEHPPVYDLFEEALRRIDGHAPVFRAAVPFLTDVVMHAERA